MIELLYKQTCPFSKAVLEFLDEEGIDSKIELHDVTKEPKAYERLQSLTGKTQVPCLVINDEPMLESQKIISWLKKHESEI